MKNLCCICQSSSALVFDLKVLNKYDVKYFQCSYCRCIYTESPYWLAEAYSSPITNLDIGLVQRNLECSLLVDNVLSLSKINHEKFLDFGGGYGLFVRMMRDKGYNFFLQDKYCENLFAKDYEIRNLKDCDFFDLITLIEVVEHNINPRKLIQFLLSQTDSIFFTTELVPQEDLKTWNYLIPETGQHIFFLTELAIKIIARENGLYYYSSRDRFHLLTRKSFAINPLKNFYLIKFFKKLNSAKRTSLLEQDYDRKVASLIA